MGYLAATTTGIYRTTTDGRRIFSFGPLRWRQYLITDDQAPVLERRVRRYHAAGLGLIMGGAALSSVLDLSWPWLILVAAFLHLILGGPFLLRGLARVRVPRDEMVFSDAEERARNLRYATALGVPTIVLLLLACVAMGTLGLILGIGERYWVGWVLVVMMVGSGWQMFRFLLLAIRPR
jgi:hypothetical protein